VPGRSGERRAQPVAFDALNDVAVLHVPGLNARPLRLAAPQEGQVVAILGYPESGPFRAVGGRIGDTSRVVSEDVYGNRPRTRTMTSLSGRVRHGNSGGPAVDGDGVVRATIFGAARRSATALGVPASIVRAALDAARGRVSTGRCLH
jgi:S1-C subfamily serine protease